MIPAIQSGPAVLYLGDVRQVLGALPSASVQCCITSPPYWMLRDYNCEGQIGLEESVEEYIAALLEVFSEVRRVLKDDGTLWLNVGDKYLDRPYPQSNLKTKDLAGVPWQLALALREQGWYLRSDIIWSKPNPLPESVSDRPTRAHEYLFLLAKSADYFYDAHSIRDTAFDWSRPNRDKREEGWAKHNGFPGAI
ncbi:MAG: DNA-methyltransferase, partial [Candidatus Dormibacteraceae bacterium]